MEALTADILIVVDTLKEIFILQRLRREMDELIRRSREERELGPMTLSKQQ